MATLSRSANLFAVDLFQTYLRRHGDKYRNLLLCPYLVYHSLAMMLVGARGSTARQLVKLLRIPPNLVAPDSAELQSATAKSDGKFSKALSGGCSSPSSKTRVISKTKSPKAPGSTKDAQAARSEPGTMARFKSREVSPSGLSSGSSECSLISSQTQSLGASLRIPEAEELRHRDYLWLTEQVLHGNHEIVHQANFIYLDKSTKRTESFKAILRDHYETKPKKLEFENVDLMVKTVNEDVSRQTENIYHEILVPQEARKLEKSSMLLVSAVFFRGLWLCRFTDVKRAPFITHPTQGASKDLAAKTVKHQVSRLDDRASKQTQPASSAGSVPAAANQTVVNYMSKLDSLPIISDEQLDARIIKMPFEASDLQMLLILPNDITSDATYLVQLANAQKIEKLIEDLSKSKSKTVRVSMPIFCIDSGKISIQSTLITMGAANLFDKTKADMSGACENKPIWLHKILHRCFLICDSRGAITSSSYERARQRQGISSSSSSSTGANQSQSASRRAPDELHADHPFMYIIFDSVTKTILLMGLYRDPSETLEVIDENQLGPDEAQQLYTEGIYKT